MSLSQTFLAQVGRKLERSAEDELDATLERLLATGRAAWSQLPIAPEEFVQQLATGLDHGWFSTAALDAVHAADLYLACACVRGEPQALRALEEHFFAPLRAHLERRQAAPGMTDDVMQALRAHLLVEADGTRPRIATYGGRGALGAWLRVVAARMALRLRRRNKDVLLFEPNQALELRAPGPDPELAYLKIRYRSELEEAFRSTITTLVPRERTILRLHYLEGMNAEAISVAFNVSKRTIERRLERTRDRILNETRRLLGEKLQIEPDQLDTLMGLMQSQLFVSVSDLLGA